MERMKRLALGAFIASVAVSGLLGIFAVLSRSWGELQTKILLTTLTVTMTCLLLLCAAALREKKGAGPFRRRGLPSPQAERSCPSGASGTFSGRRSSRR